MSRLGMVAVVDWAFASRSATVGKNGAATAAPPRPRRRTRRLKSLVMVGFPSQFPRVRRRKESAWVKSANRFRRGYVSVIFLLSASTVQASFALGRRLVA